MTAWSPSAAREAVRADLAQALRADCPMVAAALREMPDAAYETRDAFRSWLRGEDLHSEALLAVGEP